MTPTECAYVAGIIDGEGWVEYKRKKVKRNTRPGKPIHNVLIIRLEVPQVDGRLIDYLMATTDEGNRDMKHYPTKPNWQRSTSMASQSSRRVSYYETDLPLSDCKKGESENDYRSL